LDGLIRVAVHDNINKPANAIIPENNFFIAVLLVSI
jgi:hypothetical protein